MEVTAVKVLLVNGSPHERGCTNAALELVAEALRENGIEAEIYWLGVKPVTGCISCRKCTTLGGRCAIDDKVNEFKELAREADGFVFGSPVHYGSCSASLKGFMDRLFFSERHGNKSEAFRLKPAAAVVSARRSGTTAALDQINRYFTMYEMPIIPSRYWCAVHGAKREDIYQDEEGVFVMRTLGRYMAYYLKCLEAGRKTGIEPPALESYSTTNFIRSDPSMYGFKD